MFSVSFDIVITNMSCLIVITDSAYVVVYFSGVSFAWRHKGALATGLSLGYAVYVGFSWRHEMGYALRAFRFGSEVKSFATSFKKLVKSGSQTLTGFFSRELFPLFRCLHLYFVNALF